MDIEGKQEWKECVEVPGVHLPQGYYFGASSLTGDLSGSFFKIFIINKNVIFLHMPTWKEGTPQT